MSLVITQLWGVSLVHFVNTLLGQKRCSAVSEGSAYWHQSEKHLRRWLLKTVQVRWSCGLMSQRHPSCLLYKPVGAVIKARLQQITFFLTRSNLFIILKIKTCTEQFSLYINSGRADLQSSGESFIKSCICGVQSFTTWRHTGPPVCSWEALTSDTPSPPGPDDS